MTVHILGLRSAAGLGLFVVDDFGNLYRLAYLPHAVEATVAGWTCG